MSKLTVIAAIVAMLACAGPIGAREIVYDAEQQVSNAQHVDEWKAEDAEIEARLDALQKKHGKRPNIIHIMWDDMKYGAIGHPMLNKVTGYTSPNDQQAGRRGHDLHPDVHGALVHTDARRRHDRQASRAQRHDLSDLPDPPDGAAGLREDHRRGPGRHYATGFFEKSHFGDVEESYLHKQGFDEAIFTLYNQFAGQMFTPEAEDGFYTVGWREGCVGRSLRSTRTSARRSGCGPSRASRVARPRRCPPRRPSRSTSKFNAMAYERVKKFIRKHARGDKPFLLDWWPNMLEVGDRTHNKPKRDGSTDRAAPRASAKLRSCRWARSSRLLEELGIAENTLVVLMADNGPMEPIWPDTYQNPGIFRGGKNDFT